MINFIVMNGNSDSVKKLYKSAKDVLNSNITFKPTSWNCKISGSGTWAYVACGDSELEILNRVIAKQSGICLVNGPVLRMKDRNDVAEAGLEASSSESAEFIFEETSGSYNFLSITSKNGLIAFGDFSGTCPIYYTNYDGVTCVSNRASSLNSLIGGDDYNKSSLSWLIGHSNIFGEETPFKNVKSITAGNYLKCPIGSSEYKIIKFSNQVWPSADQSEYLDDLNDSDWDFIAEELKKNFIAAKGNIIGDLRLSLTGGKDSRLVLAIAIGCGFKDELTTYTNGPEGSPEILCAKLIANAIGVKHQENIQNLQIKEQDFEESWQKLRWHAYRMEGYICPWDGATAGVLRGLSSDMTGFGGELYRGPGGHAKQFKNLDFIKNKDNLLSKFINYHQKMDPINILSDLYKNYQIGWLYNWLDENVKSVRLDTLPEKFFVENRLSNWNGPLAQNVVGRTKFMPLLSPKVARLVFKLSPEARNKELFHFSVMAKLAPNLISIPFLNAKWDESLQGRYGLDVSKDKFNSGEKYNPRTVQAWQAQFVENQKDEIIKLLEEAEQNSDINEVFNVSKLCNFIESNSSFNTIELKTILSSIGIAHTLLNKQDKVEDII